MVYHLTGTNIAEINFRVSRLFEDFRGKIERSRSEKLQHFNNAKV